MKSYHEHPLRILRYSAKNIWLLIFPIIRSINVIRFDRDFLYNWLRGAWFDLLIIGAILVFGFVRWFFSQIVVGETAIVHRLGFFVRVIKTIPYANMSSVTIEHPFYFKPFRAAIVRCDTSAGILNATDMKLMVSEKTANVIMEHIPDVSEATKIKDIIDPSELSVMLFSAFFSSGFSGVVYIALFLIKGGSIARDILSIAINSIQTQTAHMSGRLVLKIPFGAVLLGLFIIGTWLLSFIVNLLRYSRFNTDVDENCLNIRYGITTRKEFRIMPSHINYTDMRQNLIMKYMGMVAVNISCAGYGSDSNSMPVLTPVKKERSIGRELEHIGIFAGVRNDFRTLRTGFWNYIWLPVTLGAALIPAQKRIVEFFPKFSELSYFVLIMFEVLLGWFTLIKLTAWWTSGIALYDDKILVRCCKWSFFHTVVSERRKLVKVTFEQTIMQEFWGTCAVGFWFEGEEYRKYKVKSMSVQNAARIAELLDCAGSARLLKKGVFNRKRRK